MPRFDLIGLGRIARDRIFPVPHLPAAGGKVAWEAEIVAPGGPAALACLVARRFGFAVSCAGSVGDDEAGDWLTARLLAAGLDLGRLRRVPACPSRSAWIFVSPQGDRASVHERDPRLAYPPECVAPDWIASARLLHLDAHDADDAAAARRAAALARAFGVAVSVNLSNPPPARRRDAERLLIDVDHLIGSARFPARLDPRLPAGPLAALQALHARYGCEVVAVTLGAEGVLALERGRPVYVPGYRVAAVDVTAAGAVFHGAYLVALLRGWPLRRRLEFAAALAALNCTAWGGLTTPTILDDAAVAALQATAPRNVRAGMPLEAGPECTAKE